MKMNIFLMSLIFTQLSLADIGTTKLPSYGSSFVKTVDSVDLNKYSGLWYEIAAVPQVFQKHCVRNTTAEYKLINKSLIAITNSCESQTGERITALGRARVAHKKSQAKFEILFMTLYGWKFTSRGQYWILGLGEGYSYAVVGTPDRSSAWILSRTPELRQDYLVEANAILNKEGFNTCRLMTSIQTLGIQQSKSLCSLF